MNAELVDWRNDLEKEVSDVAIIQSFNAERFVLCLRTLLPKVAMVTAKVALRATAGLDVDMSGLLNAVNDGAFEGLDVGASEFLKAFITEGAFGALDEIADRTLDEEALSRVVSGEEVAGDVMQRDTTASYEVLTKFMDKEKVKRSRNPKDVGYIDFSEKMERWTDGKGGMVWVRTENVSKWRDSHPHSAPCR